MVAHSTQILKNITRCWKVKANQCNRWKLTQHLFNKLHLLSTPATVSVTSEWKNRRRMQGKYKRIWRRCERKHWVKVSQAVAIFVPNSFNWMPWRMKKKEKNAEMLRFCSYWPQRSLSVAFFILAPILFFSSVNIFTVKISFNAIKYEAFYFSLFYYSCCRWVLRLATFIL